MSRWCGASCDHAWASLRTTCQSSGVAHFTTSTCEERTARRHRADFRANQRRPLGHHLRVAFADIAMFGPPGKGLTALGCGRNYLDRPSSVTGGRLSGSTASLASHWAHHMLRAPDSRTDFSGDCFITRVKVPWSASLRAAVEASLLLKSACSSRLAIAFMARFALVGHSGTHVQDVGTDL